MLKQSGFLLKYVDPNRPSETLNHIGQGALHYAIDCFAIHWFRWDQKEERVRILRMLVESERVKKDMKDRHGNTPLHYAVIMFLPLDLFSLILNFSDINGENASGKTALWLAVKQASLEKLKILLADPRLKFTKILLEEIKLLSRPRMLFLASFLEEMDQLGDQLRDTMRVFSQTQSATETCIELVEKVWKERCSAGLVASEISGGAGAAAVFRVVASGVSRGAGAAAACPSDTSDTRDLESPSL